MTRTALGDTAVLAAAIRAPVRVRRLSFHETLRRGVASTYTLLLGLLRFLSLLWCLHPPRTRGSKSSMDVQPAGPALTPLLVDVEEVDTTLRLRLEGEFDLAAVGAVERALRRLARAPVPRRVVFDLRGVSFLDLAGLRTILRVDARARSEPFEVVVVRPRGTASRIFTLTRVGDQLNVVNEPELA